MKTAEHNGCKIQVKAGRGAFWGSMDAMVNGEYFPVVEKFDELDALAEIKRTLDYVHADGIDGDRYPANYYAPGTYELCAEGIHPKEIGGACKHFTCLPD